MVFYVNSQEKESSSEIAFLLRKCILHHPGPWSELIFLCIGSDRVTGDCLGPYIGHQLSQKEIHGVYVYGTLCHPVHALNLERHPTLSIPIIPRALSLPLMPLWAKKSTWDT